MANDLPADVRVVLLSDGVRYVLPRRELGKGRWVGLLPLAMGLFATGFMAFWMWMPISGGIHQLRDGKAFGWAMIAFGALGLFGLLTGLGLMGLGIALLTNATHSEVEISGGKLRAIERFGLIKWTRKRPVAVIEKLELGSPLIGSETSRGADPSTIHIGAGLDPNLSTIRAMGKGIKLLIVAPGYPRQWLMPLAEALSERMSGGGLGGRSRLFDRDEPRVKVVERPAQDKDSEELDEAIAAELLEPPVDAKSTLERRDDGLTITVPPSGLFRGTKGMGCFAVLWNLFVAGFITIMVVTTIRGNGPEWFVYLFMIPFVAAGVGMGLLAANMGKRRAIIDVVGDTLLISRQGIFGARQHEWPAGDIAKIIVGPSGMEVNDKPIYELQIHPRTGKKVGLLGQLDEEELEWIALRLRRALGVPKHGH